MMHGIRIDFCDAVLFCGSLSLTHVLYIYCAQKCTNPTYISLNGQRIMLFGGISHRIVEIQRLIYQRVGILKER